MPVIARLRKTSEVVGPLQIDRNHAAVSISDRPADESETRTAEVMKWPHRAGVVWRNGSSKGNGKARLEFVNAEDGGERDERGEPGAGVRPERVSRDKAG